MYYFENEQLIALVKERPVLWDKSIEHNKCRISTSFAWKEVCSKLHENYECLDDHDKENFGRQVIKRWTNLKDCWWRSLKKEAGGNRPGIRPYRYHKEMNFLKKNQRQQKNGTPVNISDVQESDTSGSDNLQPDIEIPVHVYNNTEKHDTKVNQEPQSAERTTDLRPTDDRHISFFKGILPALHSLHEDQVLQFQIEVLRVLHQIKYPKHQLTTSTVSSNF